MRLERYNYTCSEAQQVRLHLDSYYKPSMNLLCLSSTVMKHYIKLVQLFYRLYLTSPNIGVVCNCMVACISSNKTTPNFIIISKVMATTLYTSQHFPLTYC